MWSDGGIGLRNGGGGIGMEFGRGIVLLDESGQ